MRNGSYQYIPLQVNKHGTSTAKPDKMNAPPGNIIRLFVFQFLNSESGS